MSVIGSQIGMMPGMGTAYTTYELSISWGGEMKPRIITGARISAACVDARSSPTYRLQPGLVLGIVTSTGEWTNYSATATDGSSVARGILLDSLSMQDVLAGSTVDRVAAVLVGGTAKNASLGGLDQKARSDFFGRIVFDDDFFGNRFGWKDVVAKTADYTVTASDNGTVFTTRGASGAVNFTLPTIAKGLRYRFTAEADQNLTVTASTADTLVCFNDLAADSVAFSTAGQKIGGSFEVFPNDNATKWLIYPLVSGHTVTVAT